MGQETVADGNVGLLFFHGSPDAPEVDITAGGSPIFDDVSYSEFSGYLELPASEYQVAVTPANDNSTIVAEYKKDFSFWNGQTAVIFASGFLSEDEPGFQPWVALSNGGTFPMDAVATLTNPNTGSSSKVKELTISPNPTSDFIQVQMNLENETDMEMSIFNNLGQTVLTKDFGVTGRGQTSFELNLNDLQTGIYFLQIRTDDSFEMKQIQVVK